MEYSHQVHGLWSRDGGLHLWVERTEGRVVVTDTRDCGPGDLPREILQLMQVRPLRLRGKSWVATPRGKLKRLPVPVVAFTPAQSLGVFAALKKYVDGLRPQYGGTVPGMSPELVYLVDLYSFVLDVVRAGRVMMRMERVDAQWYPRWMMSTGGDHHRVLQRFQEAVPTVLVHNGGDSVVEDCADELTHWATVRLLGESLGETAEIETPFVRALIAGEPARRVSADTVSALNRWRTSAEDEASRVVFLLSSPSDATFANRQRGSEVDPGTVNIDDVRWRLELAVSINDGPLQPLVAAEATEPQIQRLHRVLDRARKAWAELDTLLLPVDRWLETGAWFPPAEVVTGKATRDRIVSVGLRAQDVESLLSKGIGRLSAAGVQVMVPRGWTRVAPKVRVTANPVGTGPGSGKLGMEQLVEFDWDVSVDDLALDASARRALLDSASSVVAVNGRFVYLERGALDRARGWFRQIIETSYANAQDSEERQKRGKPQVTLRELMEADALASDSIQEDGDHDFRIEANGWMERLFSAGEIDPPQSVEVPQLVASTLRDHQRRGLNWLVWMWKHRLGSILADDMGLGKTLQVLALLAWELESEGGSGESVPPTLVIAPTSVVGAWKQEAARHTPELKVLVDHGAGRVAKEEFPAAARAVNIVVTSYGTLSRNAQRYAQVQWRRIVADEAQNIKNPATKQSRAARGLPAEHRIALTGTPVENKLSDLYALMDFANPGILGSAAAFQNRLAIPVERHHDHAARERLKRVVQPFILRRLKTDENMELNLPKKQDKVELIPLTNEQAALYEAYVRNMEQMMEQRSESRRGMILGALVKIKQICNHPAHYSGDGSGLMKNGQHRSHKVRRLFEIIDTARAEGRKVLVFTQFPSFGSMLIPEMERRYLTKVPMLHGGISRAARVKMVEEFQSPSGPPIMVLSVRAGGTGITLTEASVVVHIDRWWNPAVEDQATDRAYRIGQNKDVTVYKLVTKGTLDERIHDIISGKRELAGAVIGSGEGWIANLDDEDLKELWRLKTASEEALGNSDASVQGDTYGEEGEG
ncbi:RNA polymerase-associated protein RapA [Corynebacterium urogenitale]|uniref:RNA polymerase-associated protein RapA n=2 Tax=Corynebacterium urogenitale TaxID=2487892 RepID=A0A5J6Z6T1_9CORY|nr:RNA polymerase-associated protein RapA [Corynebacterium urogenitale]